MSRPITPTSDPTDRQRWAAFARRVVSLARLAPSVHNTQPWRWYADGDVLELWADRERALPVLDPQGRQLVLSCGAALLHARLAVRVAGRNCRVEVLPTPGQPDHLATLHVEGEAEPTDAELALTAAMYQRHTARGPFEPRPLPPAVRARLQRAAEQEGVVLHLVPDDDRVLLAVLLEDASRRQAADPEYAAELRQWVRQSGGPDGVPVASAAEAARLSRHTDLALRDFGVRAAPRHGQEAPQDERPLLAVLLTDGDGPEDWIAAGQGVARVLLTGAAEGVGASPLNQVVDVPGARELLRRELRLLSHPQVVLRVGYGHGVGAARREVADVLDIAGSERGA